MKRSRSVIIAFAVTLLFAVTANALYPYSGDVYRGCGGDADDGEERVVALTFDDGPHEEKTDEILAVLQTHGVKATFFMIGKNTELYPDVASRVIEAGHEVGNHTYSHKFLTNCTVDSIRREFTKSNDAIFAAAEYKPHFVRPPGGIYDCNVITAAEHEDLVVAMWSIDTLDWCHRSTDAIADEVLDNVRHGDIILMHDYVSGESHTAEALEKIIPALKERGYKFVTLSDMYLNYGD